ncbi:MAG: zinc ABC transporter substrate-binding protein, partial [Aestuariivirga sp.]
MKKFSLSSAAVAAFLFWSISHAEAGQIHAVASFSILADIVSHVGGENVTVTSVVGPDEDSHVYEPTPKDAVALAKADIVIINGLGLEGWLARMDQTTSTKAKVMIASSGIAPLKLEEDGQQVADPHAWQSLANGLIYARNIADALCEIDAEDCDA